MTKKDVNQKQNNAETPLFFIKHPVLFAFLKAFVFCFVFLFVCEAGIRIYIHYKDKSAIVEERKEFKRDPSLFWRLKPNLEMTRKLSDGKEFIVKTNKQGFRFTDIPFKKPSGTFRIACYGDSITYGHGVNESDTYEIKLQEILKQKFAGKKIEALNFACPGYSSYQGWHLFNKIGKKYEPDICILAFCFADPSLEEVADKDRSAKNPLIKSIREFLYNSEFYRLVLSGHKYDMPLNNKISSNNVPRVSEEDYKNIMSAWAAEMKKRGGKVIYLGLPRAEPDPFGYFENYRRICKKTAEETGNYYIDTDEIFHAENGEISDLFLKVEKNDNYKKSEANDYKVDRIHPNEKGFEIIARAISDLIVKENLIK